MPRSLEAAFPHFSRSSVLARTVALLIGTSAIVGADTGPAFAQGAPQAMPVEVVTIKTQPVRLWTTFSGRMRAVDYAEIRPQVSGLITQVKFRDGQVVKAGDVLAVIDPRPYEAAVAKAEASLQSAQTNFSFAKAEFERAESMIKTGAIAQRVYDERANSYKVALAQISSANAELKQARVDLDHAYIKAPITGRTGRVEITLGNFVQSAQAPLITSVVSNDGIYADFDVDEQTYIKNVRGQGSGHEAEQKIAVQVVLAGDPDHPINGFIYSFDNHIDPTSGTIRARAKFANTDGRLVPGQYVSVRLSSSSDTEALMVPEVAIGSDQNKKFVMVATPENKAGYREVTLGAQSNGQRVVLGGVTSGEKVIVKGLQFVRPDAPIMPHEAPQPQR